MLRVSLRPLPVGSGPPMRETLERTSIAMSSMAEGVCLTFPIALSMGQPPPIYGHFCEPSEPLAGE